jgi:hypothetical protein
MKTYPLLLDAIRLWTGFDSEMMPIRNDARIEARFGSAAAAELLPIIKSLADDFYKTDARFTAKDLPEMGRLSEEHFKKKHPNLNDVDAISEVFSWCYTFDNK